MTYEFADGMLVVCIGCGASDFEQRGNSFKCLSCSLVMSESELIEFEIANYAKLLRKGIRPLSNSGEDDPIVDYAAAVQA